MLLYGSMAIRFRLHVLAQPIVYSVYYKRNILYENKIFILFLSLFQEWDICT